MNQQLEKGRLYKHRLRELKQHMKMMRANETHLLETVADLRMRLSPQRNEAEIQTEESGMQEIIKLREETQYANQQYF